MSKQLESKSKFLSLVLRHKPEEIGLTLDAEGWASFEELIQLSTTKNISLTKEIIQEIVATSEKKRFSIDASGEKIRANQGHSIAVDLKLTRLAPPTTLFHGTATRFIPSIQASGLIPGSRQHVHLSAAVTTAVEVGARHGKPAILKVRASDMHQDGYEFYQSENGVWLTKAVPPPYLEFPDEA
ncbi:RNA 2'-phosphotransferase [Pseudomonas sp. PDM15]|uniref:RNA 2'-phosphotransferase n=1 Tax=Pseudomonas sp. PDM15 TaxID=2769303 RepID=UPI001786B9C9|nr:RNA 2'-phosphotransferase [Pseudomonas sp. PDM15]MBD9424994.1 RNA 2'-phosphotransferase [Pseudomonas sp. PDM15]